MPLVTMDSATDFGTEGWRPVLVFADRDRSMGLVVGEIVDIVEDRLKVELRADIPGLIGMTVINGRATDVIDAGYYLTQAFGDWFGSPGPEPHGTDSRSHRVLLIDDSIFFRNLLTPLLAVAGYDVTAVPNGPYPCATMAPSLTPSSLTLKCRAWTALDSPKPLALKGNGPGYPYRLVFPRHRTGFRAGTGNGV
ncbi:MAG: two-component system chemotaxis family sensor kinase CheA [Rhodospirillaceae bacterium]|nr:MAG: two-component system chemotaxis family sensor kinase CheA [Rhodospirillaceae bacterium]